MHIFDVIACVAFLLRCSLSNHSQAIPDLHPFVGSFIHFYLFQAKYYEKEAI